MIPENKSITLRVIIACTAIRACSPSRASRSSPTSMIKVKTVSSSLYKPCLVNRYKLRRNNFCGRLGEPSYLCLVWSILFEGNQYIVHPPPPPQKKKKKKKKKKKRTKKKKKKKKTQTPQKKKKKKKKNIMQYRIYKGCLRGRFFKSGKWGNLMKKDLEMFSFSRLSKA